MLGERVVVHTDSSGAPQATRTRRPFDEVRRDMRDVLLERHAGPSVAWLMGDNALPPSAAIGANAEVALATQAAIRFGEYQLGESRETQVLSCLAWLRDRSERHPDQTACWDHSTWDTATVLQTFMAAARCSWSERVRNAVSPIDIEPGLRWLISRHAETSRVHALFKLNPAELAEVTQTFVEALAFDPSMTTRASSVLGPLADPRTLLTAMIRSLLANKSDRRISVVSDGADRDVAVTWWGDFFGTAEVLRSFLAVAEAGAAGIVSLESEDLDAMRQATARAVLLLEDSNSDGLWGAYLDTVAVLGVYVRLGADTALLPDAGDSNLWSQARIVFRALRWMCDGTQHMADGSVLHTAFLTTFFARTIMDVAEHWDYSRYDIATVYDEMCLMMETGVGEHRAMAVELALARDGALRREESTAALLERARADVSTERWMRRRSTATVAVFGFAMLAGGVAAAALGWVDVKVKQGELANLLALSGVGATSVMAVIATLWSVRGSDDRR